MRVILRLVSACLAAFVAQGTLEEISRQKQSLLGCAAAHQQLPILCLAVCRAPGQPWLFAPGLRFRASQPTDYLTLRLSLRNAPTPDHTVFFSASAMQVQETDMLFIMSVLRMLCVPLSLRPVRSKFAAVLASSLQVYPSHFGERLVASRCLTSRAAEMAPIR